MTNRFHSLMTSNFCTEKKLWSNKNCTSLKKCRKKQTQSHFVLKVSSTVPVATVWISLVQYCFDNFFFHFFAFSLSVVARCWDGTVKRRLNWELEVNVDLAISGHADNVRQFDDQPGKSKSYSFNVWPLTNHFKGSILLLLFSKNSRLVAICHLIFCSVSFLDVLTLRTEQWL